jgi:hypothetical protein
MEIKNKVKVVDKESYQPLVNVVVQMTMEDLQRPPAQIGVIFMNQFESFVQPRPKGLQIIPVNTPCIRVTYTTKAGGTEDICKVNETRIINFNTLYADLEKEYGEDADIFFYTCSSQPITTEGTMESSFRYMLRCCAITKKEREDMGLLTFVAGGVYDN